MTNYKTAVVILNWNGVDFLRKFLSIIYLHTKDCAKIYLADNASTDDSVGFVRSNFSDIEIIENDKNYGFAEGYNRALQHVDAKYYVLLNSDIETTPNWLVPLIEYMDNNEDVGVCQPKLRSWHNKNMFEYAGAAGGFIDKWGYPFCRGRLFQTLEEDKGQYDNISEVFWATGACMIVRANIYKEIEGLDADFFAHMEEIDFCWRVKNLGYKVVCNPNSVVYHFGGGTLPKSNPHKTFLNFRNNLFLLFKNMPVSKLIFLYPLRIVLDFVAAIKFFTEGNTGDMLSVFRAHWAFILNLKKTIRKRKSIKNKTFHKEIFPESIIVNYYVRKKKYFRELNKWF